MQYSHCQAATATGPGTAPANSPDWLSLVGTTDVIYRAGLTVMAPDLYAIPEVLFLNQTRIISYPDSRFTCFSECGIMPSNESRTSPSQFISVSTYR
jgi:hypothetical protein